MKSIFTLTIIFFTNSIFCQSLLDINENEKRRQMYNASKLEPKISAKRFAFYTSQNPALSAAAATTKADAEAKAAAEKKAFPLAAFGSDLNTGSDAIGFRPSIVAGAQFTKGVMVIQPSIKTTQVNDQKFNVEKTGQSLFVSDISNFSANLGTVIGVPNMSIKDCRKPNNKDQIEPWWGVTASVHLQGNSLFHLDSTSFKSEKNDIFSLSVRLGLEIIIIKESFSLYADLRAISITNNRDAFHDYFPQGAQKDFLYGQYGIRFRSIDGIEEFKDIVFDISVIGLTKRMKVIAGSQNTIIPVVKIGYVKKIDWKNRS